ncbi:LPXTG cell wall anchor domain-containing protein [Leucobacter sp. 7(1)]|uniref:LPXTG cell wall anchor domain-containing protein n=1 Tax=Leucobacter sp. 7(1) TaxID=1255613 RepID=UPI0015952E58|nr:LPXTG cell wall anchor domain-containing protein [Leucobacter sp. 7(1)]
MRHRVGAGLRASLGLAACAAVVVGLIAPSAAVATDGEAAPSSYSDVRLEWGINSVYQSPSPGGTGCSFFSAGTQLEFAAESGDVRIVKRAEDGSSVPVTKNSICLGKPGTELGQRMQFNGGSGQIDPVAGTGTLRWSGAVTANGYGGMVPWWIQDPALTFSGDGTAVLTATAGGWASSMENPTEMSPLRPRAVTVATFSNVELGADSLSLTPDFGGVDYFKLSDPADPASPRATQSTVNKGNPEWGSWPESFVDFHYETGLESYWHSSGSGGDGEKPGMPIVIELGEQDEPVVIPQVVQHVEIDRPRPLIVGHPVTFSAVIDGAEAVTWEIAPEPEGPWTPIAGATTQSWAVDSVTAEQFNDRFVRMSGTNSVGTVSAGSLYVRTVPFQELAITAQPLPVHTTEGNKPVFSFTAEGSPAATTFSVEQSRDRGKTWQVVEGTSYRKAQLGRLDQLTLPPATAADHGTVLRGVAKTGKVPGVAEAGYTATTTPVVYVVAQKTGKPQISAWKLPGFSEEAGGAIAVSGAGFTIPNSETGGSYSLDVALFNRDVWVPGHAGEPQWVSLSEDSRNGQYYQAYMAYYGGSFETVIQVPAGALSADKPYGVGTLLRHYAGGVNTYENRDMDTLSEVADPVLVEIVDPEPEPGTEPGTDPGTEPGTEPGTDPSTEPGTDPSAEPGTDPGTEPGTDPGTGVTPVQPQTGASPGGQGTSAKLAQTGSGPSVVLLLGGISLIVLGAGVVALRRRAVQTPE